MSPRTKAFVGLTVGALLAITYRVRQLMAAVADLQEVECVRRRRQEEWADRG